MAANRMCPNCRAFVEPSTKICPYCDLDLHPTRRRIEKAAGPLGSFIPDSHFTTIILLAINFGLFVAMMALSQKLGAQSLFSIDGRVLEFFGAKSRYPMVVEGQWWRLVTAGFLHAGVFHILMNSWAMFDLGAQVEQIFGTARYLVIYLLSSAFGFWVSLLLVPFGNSVGASAALSGLIGAMMAYAKATHQSFVWSFYLRWAIMLVVIGLIFPAIDNAAHFGGFIAGFGVGWIASTARVNRQLESLWKLAAICLSLVAAACLAYAYIRVTQAI